MADPRAGIGTRQPMVKKCLVAPTITGNRLPWRRQGLPTMQERDWLIPSVVLTLVCGGVAFLAISHPAGLIAAVTIFPAWIAAAAIIGGLCILVHLAHRKVSEPFRELLRLAVVQRARLTFVTVVVMLAGLNMITFMWIKPLLNYYVPFSADPFLAHIDNILFLGEDPWRLFARLNFPTAGLIYHPAWFVMMILALIVVAWAPPSPRKSAMMLTYFLLWSLIGPLVHSLMPAAGPLFYERLGYGDRFADLQMVPETKQVADYLWLIYASKQFGAGSGISAMPSLHVTMSVWTAMALHANVRWFAVPAALFAALVFLLSIALGWHYAIDGIAGAACAIGCYRVLLAVFRARAMPSNRLGARPQTLAPLG